jgi:hypothetical protein
MTTSNSNTNRVTPQDKTQYKRHDFDESGHKIFEIYGANPQSIVYKTDEGFIRWEVSDKNPPTYYQDAVNIFDKFSLEVHNAIIFKTTKNRLEQELSKVLFGAMCASSKAEIEISFDDIKKAISQEVHFQSRMIYIVSSLILFLIICATTFTIYLRNIEDISNLLPVIYDLLLGFGFGTLGAFFSILKTSNKLEIPKYTSPLEHFFWGGIRIIVGGLSGFILLLMIKGGVLLDFISDKNIASYIFATVAGYSERYIAKQLQELAKD